MNRRDETRVTFRHDDFPNMLLYSVQRHCDADESPANEEQCFMRDESAVNDMQIDNNDDDKRELPTLSGNLREDINRARCEGFLVDDDDEPVVKSIPANYSNNEECVCKLVGKYAWILY